jgi:uncharacterized membrane protein YvbJ
MEAVKCAACGIINFSGEVACKKCGVGLSREMATVGPSLATIVPGTPLVPFCPQCGVRSTLGLDTCPQCSGPLDLIQPVYVMVMPNLKLYRTIVGGVVTGGLILAVIYLFVWFFLSILEAGARAR